ncbi:MAG: putative SprT family Zn-dependent metalloprotease [Bacteroidia bacterium]
MNKIEIVQFAEQKLEEHGLAQKGWIFTFNQAITYAGICDTLIKEIQLSQPISKVETQDFIVDTILHEIAHAIVGAWHNHDRVWKACAKRIGARPEATYTDSESITSLRLSKTKYVICFGAEIVQLYLRKPNKKTIANITEYWIPKRKEETEGNLKIEVYNSSIHYMLT